MTQTAKDDNTLTLPRILCLHGGGTNADIFQLQCRSIIRRLVNDFRFVFVDAPFTCQPHPTIEAFFGDCGPFYRWLRWDSDHDQDGDAANKILERCHSAMDNDSGTGPWVAVLGFSQGGELAASLLWAQENINNGDGPFKFGVIMAGRAPIVLLDPKKKMPSIPHIANISLSNADFTDWPADNKGAHAISTPTLHVHGLHDTAIDRHQVMLKNYCKEGTTKVVEWDGDHRLPIKTDDVELVVTQIIELAKQTGVI